MKQRKHPYHAHYPSDNLSLITILKQNRYKKRIQNYRKKMIIKTGALLSNPENEGKKTNRHFFKIFQSPLIFPNRFVYHVSPRENREKIIRLGLLPHPCQNAVFANNMDIDYLRIFYPFYFFDCATRIMEYDFWIIDTSRVDAYWHIDPFMGRGSDYICTQQNIPANALRLITIKPTELGTCFCGCLHMTNFRVVHHENINQQLVSNQSPLPIIEPHTLCYKKTY